MVYRQELGAILAAARLCGCRRGDCHRADESRRRFTVTDDRKRAKLFVHFVSLRRSGLDREPDNRTRRALLQGKRAANAALRETGSHDPQAGSSEMSRFRQIVLIELRPQDSH